MSYQVLARKWRPKSFASLVGQEHVVRALEHALTEKRLHHAYLFTGTRGVGKTTLARILAKSLNCEQGVSPTPCGVCSACQEIDSGRFVDLLEVDAATNTKVEEMRQLLENAVYAPTRGRFKVYVIDEVHMLSSSAFNAMLKTLEEPPEHVKFILATTDPQKIPVTVLSRCLQFNLKQMTVPAIAAHLKNILAAEAIFAEPAALTLIARSAAGSMRDALSLLDQAIAHGAGRVEEALVRDMLGTVDLDYLYDIFDALSAGDAAAMLQVADAMAARSLSVELALQEMASLLTRVQVAQLAAAALPEVADDAARLMKLAGALDPEFVQLAYQIVVHGRRDLPLAPDETSGLVMTLLRLFAFRPQSDAAGRPSVTPAAPAQAPQRQAPKPDVRRVSDAAVRPAPVVPPASQPSAARVAESASAPVSVPAVVQPAAPAISQVPDATPAAPPSVDTGASTSASSVPDWHQLLSALQLSGMARELANHCELRRLDESSIVLRLSPVHRHLLMRAPQEKLQQVLGEHFGRTLKLSVEIGDVERVTPAESARQERQERQERAVAAIEEDEFVRAAIEVFDASPVESSIQPL
ncbi:DNA polymerase III subunit gamma/tau [Rhodocyclus purpureus]|uniref:DNA polymerase III subunit gamma/tau n=1 Tax=Rhodocyclus purpureus TaxID=1067 RepID=UPI001913A3A9|nr:DNA polymerase III subunit gamma/tau [Rhodocyclus purpureus]MBK5913787.1 DNA polymerase III subunit gamma/tau [Rhodocyclus purpureus]